MPSLDCFGKPSKKKLKLFVFREHGRRASSDPQSDAHTPNSERHVDARKHSVDTTRFSTSQMTQTRRSSSGDSVSKDRTKPRHQSRRGIWMPPPLFLVYHQSSIWTAAPGSIHNEIMWTPRPSKTFSRDDEPASRPGAQDSHRQWTSLDLASFSRKVWVLSAHGYVLQYAEAGPASRLPERVLQITEKSAAAPADIPEEETRYGLMITNLTGSSLSTPRSLSTRTGGQSFKGSLVQGDTASLLIILRSQEELSAWLITVRQRIGLLQGFTDTYGVGIANMDTGPDLVKRPGDVKINTPIVITGNNESSPDAHELDGSASVLPHKEETIASPTLVSTASLHDSVLNSEHVRLQFPFKIRAAIPVASLHERRPSQLSPSPLVMQTADTAREVAVLESSAIDPAAITPPLPPRNNERVVSQGTRDVAKANEALSSIIETSKPYTVKREKATPLFLDSLPSATACQEITALPSGPIQIISDSGLGIRYNHNAVSTPPQTPPDYHNILGPPKFVPASPKLSLFPTASTSPPSTPLPSSPMGHFSISTPPLTPVKAVRIEDSMQSSGHIQHRLNANPTARRVTFGENNQTAPSTATSKGGKPILKPALRNAGSAGSLKPALPATDHDTTQKPVWNPSDDSLTALPDPSWRKDAQAQQDA